MDIVVLSSSVVGFPPNHQIDRRMRPRHAQRPRKVARTKCDDDDKGDDNNRDKCDDTSNNNNDDDDDDDDE